MGTRPARGWWLALLFGAVLAIFQNSLPAAPKELPPEGFVRQDLKEIRATVLRPDVWIFRRAPTTAPVYQCSPQPFTGSREYASGVQILTTRGTNNRPADEYAAARVAQLAEKCQVLRGWAKKGVPAEPFTTYGMLCVMQNEGTDLRKCTCEILYVANRVTNTVYVCSLYAPVGEWKNLEATGETMLASLRLDPGI